MARLVDGLHTSRTTKLGDEYKPRALLHTAVPRFTALPVAPPSQFLFLTPEQDWPPPVSLFTDDAETCPAPNTSVYEYQELGPQLQAPQQG